MLHVNNELILYKQLLLDSKNKLQFFLEKHSTKEGTWGLLQLEQGEINFILLDGAGQALIQYHMDKNNPLIEIPPAVWHKIQLISSSFNGSIKFYCQPHRYFNKKYSLNNVHHDLYYVYKTYFPQDKRLKILDLGCGSGRNLLYLALLGHQVTGIDINNQALEKIKDISEKENLTKIKLIHHDLNKPLSLDKEYDAVISLVSLQFLETQHIASLLQELQTATINKGLHLIVTPIKADPYKLPDSFKYLPESKQIYSFYQNAGWSILEYKESVGQLHRLDETGKPIQGMFALLVATKN